MIMHDTTASSRDFVPWFVLPGRPDCGSIFAALLEFPSLPPANGVVILQAYEFFPNQFVIIRHRSCFINPILGARDQSACLMLALGRG